MTTTLQPSSLQPWRTLTSRTVFQNHWLQVDVDAVELPDGQVYEYTHLRRDRHGAAVFACNDQGQILLEQEFRYPVQQVIWQLPGGLIDAGEGALAAAKRELAEETGHIAADWRLLGTIWDNPAFEDMAIHIYLARDISRDGATNPDQAEYIRWAWKDSAWVFEQLRSGQINDRVLAAAVGLCWAHGIDLHAGNGDCT